jgi:serine protease Do
MTMRMKQTKTAYPVVRNEGAAKWLPFVFQLPRISLPVARGAMLLGLAALLLSVLMAQSASAQDRRIPQAQDEIRLSFAPIVRQAAPAVTNIFAKRVVRGEMRSPLLNDPFLRRFFDDGFFGRRLPRERMQNTLGSGVLVRSDGVIVTNNHVIENMTEIRVVLSDRREFDAEVILTDPQTDLAVLKIDPGDEVLPVLPFADSDSVEVGDLVLAIGNPFGVGQTVTSGIVSATSRTQAGVSDYQFFIQTDAAINPGNSGGALVGVDGRLIGVNTAIFSRSGGSIGIGFAIPSNMVERIVESALNDKVVVRPWLGASGQVVTADIAASLGLARPIGILISHIYPNGPAAKAGLKVGDVLMKIDGWEIYDPQSLRYRIATGKIGGEAAVTVWRDGGARDLLVPLLSPPEDPPRNLTLLAGKHPLTGLTIANLSPAFSEELGIEGEDRGVIIAKIPPASPARRLGLRQGDILVKIGDTPIARVSDVVKATDTPRKVWELQIKRGDRIIGMRISA